MRAPHGVEIPASVGQIKANLFKASFLCHAEGQARIHPFKSERGLGQRRAFSKDLEALFEAERGFQEENIGLAGCPHLA